MGAAQTRHAVVIRCITASRALARQTSLSLQDYGLCAVQDDFQLICFDMVSDPSTPGAFMMSEGKEITEAELNNFFNKSDRIDRVFNDILSWEDE